MYGDAANPLESREALMTDTVLPTTNPAWGFFGTIARDANPDEAWAIALPAVAAATGCPDAAARDFLDSRNGRHFADDVANGLAAGMNLHAAINAAIGRWMGWRTGRHTERSYGIPRGLPYLTGFVTHYEIAAESMDA